MKTTVKWLKEYVDFDLFPFELGEILTMAGLEVDSITPLAHDKIVSARVEKVRPHPNADRLSLCSVTDGATSHEIVCGASNMKAGDMVVLALPGAEMPQTASNPEGMTIRRAKIRGSESGGMLCSENEIGLSPVKSDGIMILRDSVVPGTRLADIEGVEDTVLEIAVTPNRPDCLSIIGIAREIAVATGGALKIPPSLANGADGIGKTGGAKVNVENKDGCPRYCCVRMDGVRIESSPLWLRARLSACGIRPVNNLVDATNLVLLEFGQPLHAFDADLIKNGLTVRRAVAGESIKALDSEKYDLDAEDLVIADANGPVAIAGVMGGEDSGVNESTKNILIEAACFNSSQIRRTSKRLKLSSEASYRFERGVDPTAAPAALKRVAEIINQVAGGSEPCGFSDVYSIKEEPREVEVSLEKMWKTLGTSLPSDETERLLTSLGFEVSKSGSEGISVKIPSFRPDVSRAADIFEEMARLIGYNAIPQTEPNITVTAQKVSGRAVRENAIKNAFLLSGFCEAVNYGFDNPELLRIFGSQAALGINNPISNEMSAMRTTLLTGLMRNLKFNLSRQCADARLFEEGRVFFPKSNGELPEEERVFAAVAAGEGEPDLWKSGGFDFFDMKGLFEKILKLFAGGDEDFLFSVEFKPGSNKKHFHPGKSARIFAGGTEIGDIGEIHPDTARAFEIAGAVALELSLEKLYSCNGGGEVVFSPLPKFPSLRRDLAFLVKKDLEIGNVISGVQGVSPLVERVWIFDLFEDKSVGKDMKSVGVSMLLRSAKKTLTDEEANSVCEKASRTLGDLFGAQIR
ncbi:MAG: phenylalanine--tRNA ligase subunit beta [Candidatus Mycalebacterium zealandia]|nr:MAG: phenylalanine--tRNA ligase subunit beta [Candidatus Mycalebacterium zealandia]